MVIVLSYVLKVCNVIYSLWILLGIVIFYTIFYTSRIGTKIVYVKKLFCTQKWYSFGGTRYVQKTQYWWVKFSFNFYNLIVTLENLCNMRPVILVKALYGREVSGPFNRRQALAGCPYKNIQQLGKTLGHLSAVYCVLFDTSGRYIFTVWKNFSSTSSDRSVVHWAKIEKRILAKQLPKLNKST